MSSRFGLLALALSMALVSCGTALSERQAAAPADGEWMMDEVSPLNPSAATRSYAAQVTAVIQRHIALTAPVDGDPTTEIEVRTRPDGVIAAFRIVKGSGVSHWDDAVLLALTRSGPIPPDVDGRVPTVILIRLRPTMLGRATT